MNVLTVMKSGGEYNESHVMKLKDMAEKFIPQCEFKCLSDVDVTCDRIALSDGERGWWAKIELFKVKGPCLYFDLDTVILGDLSAIIDAISDEKFVILRDFYRKGLAMQSSMMYWSGDMTPVYDLFKRRGKEGFEGDQNFIEYAVREATYWQDVVDGIVSFKVDVLKRGVSDKDKVVIFHGEPRPWRQNVVRY